MSNTGRLDPITVLSHGEPFLFIIWILVSVSPKARAPSVAAKLRLVARFVALAGLVEVRGSYRCLVSSPATWWSLSGSNR